MARTTSPPPSCLAEGRDLVFGQVLNLAATVTLLDEVFIRLEAGRRVVE